VSDAVPSTPVFEMYPVGLTSIGARLERDGWNVRIVNLACRMLRDPAYDVDAVVRRLDPALFGIDLHWLVHAHGALEVAGIVKRHHSRTPVIVGGISATYYHRELIRHPYVDLVLRGDSTEEAMAVLMRVLCLGGSLADVPGLTWKDEDGRVVENAPAAAPPDLGGTALPDYGYVVRSVLRHRSLADVIPYADWPRYPMTGLLTSRGCAFDCAICGGSESAGRCISGRDRPAFRPADALVRDIRTIGSFSRGPIILLNDVRMAGVAHTRRFFELLRARPIANELVFELFAPPGKRFLAEAAEVLPRFSLELSIESQRQDLRRRFGKFACSNEVIERSLAEALRVGVQRVDLFFMIGLPGQTYRDAVECVDYCRHLLDWFAGDRRLQLFIAPLTPFLDPGSPAFERPDAHGYRVRYRTLEDHRQALTAPTWKQMLNYETDAMSADEIVAATYECYERLAELKRDAGRMSAAECEAVIARSRDAQAVIEEVDAALALANDEARDERLAAARGRIHGLQQQKSAAAEELKWAMPGRFAAPLSAARFVAGRLAVEVWRLLTRRVPLLWRAARAKAVEKDAARGELISAPAERTVSMRAVPTRMPPCR
jgi:B12-binding domain/radical SAM domain protein